MSWSETINIAGMPSGSYRSIAGYASESLVVGRALLCGYVLFVKAWRDAKYDAVLDANGSLFRIEIKGTSGDKNISTSSGGRSGEQISREVESRQKPLCVDDCDWLIATTSMDSVCWIIPIEFIDILQVENISISNLDNFKEKWGVFVLQDPNIKPYLKSGYRKLPFNELITIATNLGIDIDAISPTYSFNPSNNRLKKFRLSQHDRLVIEIWETILKSI